MNGCEVEQTACEWSRRQSCLPINDQLVRKDNTQPATASSNQPLCYAHHSHHPTYIIPYAANSKTTGYSFIREIN